jgi:phage baseplate assembly protein V
MTTARKMVRIARALVAPVRGMLRGMISRAAIGSLDVSGKGQTLQAKSKADDQDDGVELFETYGFTSAPPQGSECLVLRPGGERAKSVAIACGDRSKRPVGIAQDEVAMYHHNGIALVLRNDTSV